MRAGINAAVEEEKEKEAAVAIVGQSAAAIGIGYQYRNRGGCWGRWTRPVTPGRQAARWRRRRWKGQSRLIVEMSTEGVADANSCSWMFSWKLDRARRVLARRTRGCQGARLVR